MFLYLFAFLAGLVTVLSPCVLPVLPAILSAGIGQGRYRPLGIIIGLIISFSVFTLFLTYLVSLTGISADILRYIAIGIIALFGIVLILPSLADKFAQATSKIGKLGSYLQTQSTQNKSNFWSGILLGTALGLIWTPCAGPILAAVTTLVATQQVTMKVVLLTFAYAFGAGIPLLLLAYGGNKALTAVPWLARRSEGIRRVFGILMILTAIAVVFDFDLYVTQIAKKYAPSFEFENSAIIQKELAKIRPASPFSETQKLIQTQKGQGSELPKIALAPDFEGIVSWINTKPLALRELRGRVVLIDFWTYSCINCIRTLPYLTGWYEKYKDKGFLIIGVHTPEFEFEKNEANVEKAVKRFNINYPVALDNKYATWQAYYNNYWPAHYLIDQEGIIRQVHFGEGKYLETENDIRTLLGMQPVEHKPDEIAGPKRPITPEIYLGNARAENYQKGISLNPDKVTEYQFTLPLQEDRVGLKGQWLVSGQKITSYSDAVLELNFLATHVYLVMEAASPEKVSVSLDGKPLDPQYFTVDMDAQGQILVKEPRKYDIIDLKNHYGRHQLTLKIPPGVSLYAFTFGDKD